MTDQNFFTCKLMACISLMTGYTGIILPDIITMAEYLKPLFQDGAFLVSIIAGLVAIFKGRSRKEAILNRKRKCFFCKYKIYIAIGLAIIIFLIIKNYCNG